MPISGIDNKKKKSMELRDAVKVSYSLKRISEWVGTSEAKIPLQYHEYIMVYPII